MTEHLRGLQTLPFSIAAACLPFPVNCPVVVMTEDNTPSSGRRRGTVRAVKADQSCKKFCEVEFDNSHESKLQIDRKDFPVNCLAFADNLRVVYQDADGDTRSRKHEAIINSSFRTFFTNEIGYSIRILTEDRLIINGVTQDELCWVPTAAAEVAARQDHELDQSCGMVRGTAGMVYRRLPSNHERKYRIPAFIHNLNILVMSSKAKFTSMGKMDSSLQTQVRIEGPPPNSSPRNQSMSPFKEAVIHMECKNPNMFTDFENYLLDRLVKPKLRGPLFFIIALCRDDGELNLEDIGALLPKQYQDPKRPKLRLWVLLVVVPKAFAESGGPNLRLKTGRIQRNTKCKIDCLFKTNQTPSIEKDPLLFLEHSDRDTVLAAKNEVLKILQAAGWTRPS